MKTLDPFLRSHLDGDVTALCTCWVIERKDGVILRFTDADEDVTVDGQTYLSVGAYQRTAIESTATLSVDNLDISGIGTNLSLPVEELRAGAYDHATVKVFLCSWQNVVPGMVKLRRGFFGEVRVLPNGTFTVELRGLMQRLSHVYTDLYSATCRYDLGEAGCGVDITHDFVTAGAHIPFPIRDPGFEMAGASGLASSLYWYNPLNNGDSLFSTAPTYSGTYAATGGANGGYLVQDVPLADMGEDFLTNLDNRQVTFTCHGWRRDNGNRGRLRYLFLDHDFRELRDGQVLDLAGGHLDIPDVTVTGDFTFETWVFPTTATGAQTLFFGTVTGGDVQVSVANGILQIVFPDFVLGAFNTISVSVDWTPNEWNHVGISRSGSDIIFYFDGKIVLRQAINLASALTVTRLFARPDNSSRFTGRVDEVRLWSTHRSITDINAFRFRDLPDATAGLLRYYPFDGDNLDKSAAASGSAGPTSGTAARVASNSPVAVAFRGATFSQSTGFQNVGTAWTLVSIADVPVPRKTRYVRVIFDHQAATGDAGGTRLDSLFGWFEDAANSEPMPNFSAGPTEWSRAGMAITGGSSRVFRATVNEPRAVTGWFNGGLITFYSGKNKGASMEVKTWTQATSEIETYLSLPYPVEPGDLFTIYPGCDKTRIACAVLFDNIANFFATPDVPGEDEYLRYPDAK